MSILTEANLELFLSFLIPLLTVIIIYLSLKKNPPYPTVSFIIKITLIAIVISWIILLSFPSVLIPFLMLFLFYPRLALKPLYLFKETDIAKEIENNLTPIDKSIPLKFIFKKSTQSRISWQNYWYFILAGIFIYIVVINNNYIFLFFVLYTILIETQDIITQRFYKGSWKVTISRKELRWETPPFEKSYQINISDIKSLKKEKRNATKGFYSIYYVLETVDDKIDIDTELGIDIESFKLALAKVGVKVEA